ncbi:MAG: EVE domain-containing protein [Planctomycetes bacterium]|nr:EVE domain-containing protein [Planctomycetota bacterium]
MPHPGKLRIYQDCAGDRESAECADFAGCAALKKTAEKPGGWLFKQEPEEYSFADLVRDGKTWWDGVSNALARKHLSQVKVGDRVLFYHTGKQKAIVGEMKVVAGPTVDPESDDPRAIVVQVQPVRSWSQPVTLEEIKKSKLFSDWELVRISRLSVMPVSPR